MLPAEGDDLGVEVEARPLRGRVAREIHDDGERLGDRMAHRPVECFQELRRGAERDGADRGSGDDEAEGVDRIARIWREDDVPGAGDGLGEVGEALLGAEGPSRLQCRTKPLRPLKR